MILSLFGLYKLKNTTWSLEWCVAKLSSTASIIKDGQYYILNNCTIQLKRRIFKSADFHELYQQEHLTRATTTAEAVRIEANPPGTSAASAIILQQWIKRKCLTVEKKVNITEYNIHNGEIRWRILTSVKII